MMHGAFKKFLLLMAGSGISQNDLRRIFSEIQGMHPEALCEVILYLRHSSNQTTKEFVDSFVGYKSHRIRTRHRSEVDDVARRVETMLRQDAGLKVRDAAIELIDQLEKADPNRELSVRRPKRESFYNWVTKLLRDVSPSELLHHATYIRNKHLHHEDSDWSLKDE